MATLAVIPARLAATRLQRKPLRLLAGEPIIVRVWERVVGMNIGDRCVVATDSSEVRDVCVSAGAEVVMTSPTHATGTDRVAEVAGSPGFQGYETIVNVQGDEPFVLEEAVRQAASLVESGRFALGTAAVDGGDRDLSTPDAVKVVVADDGRALYFSRAPIPWLRSQEDRYLRDSLVRRHVGVYVYTREALQSWISLPEHPIERVERLEQLRPLAAGYNIGVAVVSGRVLPGIDTESDLAFANEQWEAFNSGRP